MTRKYLWIGLSVLLVAALILSSCSKNSTSTQTTVITQTQTQTSQTTTTTTKTTTSSPTTAPTSSGTPQTGGSLTLYTQWGFEEPSGFDSLTQRIWSGSVWINPFTEWLCRGDVEKYGPRGDNSFSFQTYETIPEQTLKGELADTWEISASPLQITFHLRHGIMFTGNAKIGMAARELTADDVVFSLLRTKSTPGPGSYLAMIKDVTATDRYTVVVSLNNYDANWFFIFGGGMAMGAIQPKEMAAANKTAEDWHNAVGTGPFTLTEYIAGVGATYTKNPNYWGTTTINGKTYQEPLIQTLYYPVIADASTMLSALRTGKIDWSPNIPMQDQQTLSQNVPALIQDQYLSGKIDLWRINRQGSKTLNKKNVRQALMIGLDLNAISKLLYSNGQIVSWPIGPQVPGYTPLAQLPAADQALYTYDTTKAKQMLADAGYPNGFSVELDLTAPYVDLANACADMWSKINVTANIKILDPTTATSYRDQVLYPDMLYTNYAVVNPLVSLHLAAGDVLATNYLTTEPFQAEYNACSQEMDPVKRTALEKQMAIDFLDDCGMIPFAQPYVLNCYWPWMKNYYNELDAGYYNQMPMIKTMWIDQTLKKSMGKGG